MGIRLSLLALPLALTLSGCSSVMNAAGLPYLTHEQYALFDSICKEAEKNEGRANDMHANKTVVSAQGVFKSERSVGTTEYRPYLAFETYYYNVNLFIGTEDDSWKQYDNGKLVDSGDRLVKSIRINTSFRTVTGSRRAICDIETTPVAK
ncbi:hypothetical protein [Succinimonas amylolytica]|uniref:hypothetical protein n=1 Tax=Succinimonas amylolytica TaxID=83769 RepID=UPI0012F7219A|nr:hypothetical protein [Succinimonas amylolytica]